MEMTVTSSKPGLEMNLIQLESMAEQTARASRVALKPLSEAMALGVARAFDRSGLFDSDLLGQVVKASEVARAFDRSGLFDSDLLGQVVKASEVARAFDRSGLSDLIDSTVNAALKPLNDFKALTCPKLGQLEKFTEQIRPVLGLSAALGEQMRLSAPKLLDPHAQFSGFSASWSGHVEGAESPSLETARSRDCQLGPADSAIEWSEGWQNALATLFIIFTVLAAIAAFGATTKVAVVDEFVIAAQILFYSIPYAVLKNPLLSSIWFWVPIYWWFVQEKE